MKEFRELTATGSGPERGRAVRAAARSLGEGHLVVHPTGTVYGLGARADREPEIRRLKGRSGDRPFLRIAAGVDQIRETHPEVVWDERVDALARAFWPGPLTLILDDGRTGGLGLRVEQHPVARELLEAYGATMASSSLNRTGYPAARTAEEVRGVLQRMPDSRMPVVFLNGGDLPASAPSTILSLLSDPPEVLRAGALPVEEIRAFLAGEVTRERS